MGTSMGPVARHPWDQKMGRSGNVRINSTQKSIKLTLTGYSRLYRELKL